MLWYLIHGESTNKFTYNNKGTVVPLWSQFSFWEIFLYHRNIESITIKAGKYMHNMITSNFIIMQQV